MADVNILRENAVEIDLYRRIVDRKGNLIRERGVKKYSHAQIQKLIITGKNILKNFGGSAG